MKNYTLRTDMFCMNSDMWQSYHQVFGKAKIIKTNIPIMIDCVGLISSKSAISNEEENEFMNELYKEERRRR